MISVRKWPAPAGDRPFLCRASVGGQFSRVSRPSSSRYTTWPSGGPSGPGRALTVAYRVSPRRSTSAVKPAASTTRLFARVRVDLEDAVAEERGNVHVAVVGQGQSGGRHDVIRHELHLVAVRVHLEDRPAGAERRVFRPARERGDVQPAVRPDGDIGRDGLEVVGRSHDAVRQAVGGRSVRGDLIGPRRQHRDGLGLAAPGVNGDHTVRPGISDVDGLVGERRCRTDANQFHPCRSRASSAGSFAAQPSGRSRKPYRVSPSAFSSVSRAAKSPRVRWLPVVVDDADVAGQLGRVGPAPWLSRKYVSPSRWALPATLQSGVS